MDSTHSMVYREVMVARLQGHLSWGVMLGIVSAGMVVVASCSSSRPDSAPEQVSDTPSGATSSGHEGIGMNTSTGDPGSDSTNATSTSASDNFGSSTSQTSSAADVSSASETSSGSETGSASETSSDSETGSVTSTRDGSNNTDGSSSDGSSSNSANGSSDNASSGNASSGNANEPLSPGCGTPFQKPPAKGQQQTVEINGSTRYYLLDVPNNADNETPLMLVFGLHGYDMNNLAVVDLFNFTQRSGGKAITVWPQGEGPHPGEVVHWGDHVLESTWVANEQNYAFLRRIMTDLGERYCIDQERIFIAGFSMGAFFTNQLACAHSDWFRAFAPVAGGGPQSCANSSVQSAIMLQHGTVDDIVTLDNGEGSRDFWVKQNGCGTSSSRSLNNCQFYDDCADDKPVAWCTGNYDHYIPDEVASNIWSFFSSF